MALVLDCRGMLCPRPIIELAKAFPQAPIDSVIEVIADDAAAAVDIPAWCRMRSQEYVGAVAGSDGAVRYSVRRLSYGLRLRGAWRPRRLPRRRRHRASGR